MKLYTEEQVKQMIEKSRETGLTAEYLILTTPAIKLPSDEDIEKESEKITNVGNRREYWKQGIKWIIDKIKNQ
jgi:hypothetical protein